MSALQQVMASFGAAGPVQGQYLIGGTAGSNVVWTVPAGVTSICVLAIQEGQGSGASGTQEPCDVLRFDFVTAIVRAQNGNRVGTGGADGGTGGAYLGGAAAGGGGGAGGYAGAGGAGGANGGAGTAGSGGAGGGGGSAVGSIGSLIRGGGGGGTGVLGQGANGTGGVGGIASGSPTGAGGGGSGGNNGPVGGATDPSGSLGALYGGGGAGVTWSTQGINNKGGNGGALSYANNVAVTPGENLLVRCYGAAGAAGTAAGCSNAAIRIIWGAGRAFPATNTGDV